jgi:putative peptidoglycan lipid II flippase
MSNRKLAKNVGSMSIAVFISRILGLARDIVMTNFFGTSYVADAFNVAFQIPNLLRKLFGEGALSAAFVPVYKEMGITRNRSEQISFAIQVLSILSLFLLLLCGIGMLFTPLIVKVLAPGFDAVTYHLAVKLTRILFPYLFFIGLSSTLIAILNSHDYFFVPGLTSAFLNIAMICALACYELIWGDGGMEAAITAWAVGAVVGGVLQTIVNLPLLRRVGYRLGCNLSLAGDALHTVWKRFLPGVVGLAIRQINLAVDLILASLLVSGSIASLNYGNRLMQLPLGIFGVSAGVAVLPLFSQYSATREWHKLGSSLRFSLLSICFIMLPVTAMIIGMGKDLIRLLFMRGAFDETSLQMTYIALVCYSFGLVFYSINRVLIPLFYANKDTRTPVKISAAIVAINIILNIVLMHFFAHAGLALATSISALIQTLVLWRMLRRKMPQLKVPSFALSVGKLLLVSAVIVVIQYTLNTMLQYTALQYLVLKLFLLGAVGAATLAAGAHLLHIEQSTELITRLWHRIIRR